MKRSSKWYRVPDAFPAFFKVSVAALLMIFYVQGVLVFLEFMLKDVSLAPWFVCWLLAGPLVALCVVIVSNLYSWNQRVDLEVLERKVRSLEQLLIGHSEEQVED